MSLGTSVTYNGRERGEDGDGWDEKERKKLKCEEEGV